MICWYVPGLVDVGPQLVGVGTLEGHKDSRHLLIATTLIIVFFLSLEVEDGGVARVAYELAEVASTPGKVKCVLGDVVSELGQTGILPALSQSCLTLLLWRGGRGEQENR